MHAKMLERLGAPYKLVKHASELAEVGGLIMPGGESTTMLKFFSNEGMVVLSPPGMIKPPTSASSEACFTSL